MGNCPCCPKEPQHEYQPIADEDAAFTEMNQRNNEGMLRPPSPPVNTSQPSPSSSSNNNNNNNNNGTSLAAPSTDTTSATVFRSFPDAQETEKEFDLNSPVFKGMVVQQKFFNKSSYDPKFVWINLSTRSLCLSEHNIKERRHKEANISDIVGVMAVAPEKYKAGQNANGETISLDPNLCLSIKFVRGGGIDLQFQTKEERDIWYHVICRLTIQEKDLQKKSSAASVLSVNKQ